MFFKRHLISIAIPLLVILFLLAPAGIAAAVRRSWRWFFVALPLVFFGIDLPLFVFGVTSFAPLDWKGACPHGWVDCFIISKLALMPLALLASFALYRFEILRLPAGAWTVAGFVLGALVAGVGGVYVLMAANLTDLFCLWGLAPFYIAIWYLMRAAQLVRATRSRLGKPLAILAGSLPFWVASIVWARRIYQSLPDKDPGGCFIVTAAGRGHPRLVGPFVEIERHGRRRPANRQLLTFWRLETRWQQSAPRSHRCFRRFYNRVGPTVAAWIRSPWLADLVYLALKPVETLAALAGGSAQPSAPERKS